MRRTKFIFFRYEFCSPNTIIPTIAKINFNFVFKSQLGQRRVTQGSCPDRLTWIMKIFIFSFRREVRERRREDKGDYKASTSVSQNTRRVKVLN